VEKDYTRNTSIQVRIKKKGKLSDSCTTLRTNSKAFERCEIGVQGHRGTCDWKKVGFKKNAGILVKKRDAFRNVSRLKSTVF